MAFPPSARESAASLSLTSAPAPQAMQHPHHYAGAAAQRVSFPSAMNLNVNVNAKALPAPHTTRPRADSSVSATATLAQFNYATYMYYLSVAALLAQSHAPPADAAGARGHMRVHSTASNTSLRSTSLSSTTSSSFDSLLTPGSARDGVRTPDTCSDIASDDDGTGCPLSELPTSCADTPVEGANALCGEREARAPHAKLASLAAAATLRSRPAQPPPPALWADDGLVAVHRPTSGFHRLRSPFADKTWWECVTHEKPWAPLATPIAKSEMPAVPLRRLSGPRSHNRNGSTGSGFEHKRSARRRPSRAASTTLGSAAGSSLR